MPLRQNNGIAGFNDERTMEGAGPGNKEPLSRCMARCRDTSRNESLSEAAKTTGVSKSTIWRACKTGRISATKNDYGGYRIEAAELFRVFPPATPPAAEMH